LIPEGFILPAVDKNISTGIEGEEKG